MPGERASHKSEQASAAKGAAVRRSADPSQAPLDEFATAAEPLARVKARGVPPDPSGFAALHRSIGNKAVHRLLQRHWLEGEEKVVLARHDPGAARPVAFGAPGFARDRSNAGVVRESPWGNPALAIRRQDGKGGGAAVADKAGAAAGAKGGAAGAISAIKFTAAEIPADGKTTTTASATTTGGASVSKWGFVGESYGSTIDNSGIITPGSDLKGKESVTLEVQATDEKSGATLTKQITLWDAPLFQSKIDFPKFLGSTYTFENFTKGFNGKFDIAYNPAAKAATATMKLKFTWPEEKVEAPSAANLWGFAPLLKHANYKINFVNQVMKQWAGRYQFQNVREPQSIWSKLNPVDVKLNIQFVESDQHFTVEVRDRAASAAKGEANQVGGGVLTLYQGADVPQPAFNPSTGDGELKRLDRVTPTPILFGLNSAEVSAADKAKLETMGQYISRINNPKFDIKVVGHASLGGGAKVNDPLGDKRAQAVVDILNSAGATNHNIKASSAGDAGAANTPDWRKAEITNAIPAGWTNMQDTTPHEFGHMLGLGDEYAGASPTATHYDLVAKAFGKDYAEQVAKRGDADHASIMDGGDDVRIQHYVTYWSALVETTLKAPVPDPKFGYDDWKFVGT